MIKSILEQQLKQLQTWFEQYVRSYESDDTDINKNILLKKNHTKTVCQEITDLGKKLRLSQQELYLAEIIALLHDVGRFEQYTRYRTFADIRSEDHARLGIKVIKEKKLLNNLSWKIQLLILFCIRHHNQAFLPWLAPKKYIFFSKLLRDADKLDIWNVLAYYYTDQYQIKNQAINLDLPDTKEVSPQVYKNIMSEKIIKVKMLKNLNDFKILQMAWIFDINFPQVFKIIKQRNYLDAIYQTMPKTRQIKNIYHKIQSYLTAKLSPA